MWSSSSIESIEPNPCLSEPLTLTSHPALHAVFEILAYTTGYQLYRTRAPIGDSLPDDQRWIIIAAAAIRALLGARILE
jgi:hypothetical protein